MFTEGTSNGLEVVGSQVNIAGGDMVGVDTFDALYGSHVVFCGGSARSGFFAHAGSRVTVVSGVVSPNLTAGSGSNVTISGGTIDGSLTALSGSEVTLVGTEFLLDGLPISQLNNAGDSLLLESRNW